MGKGASFGEERPRRPTCSPRGVLFERAATFGTCLWPPVNPSGAPVAGRGSPSQTCLAAAGQAGKEGSASSCWQRSRTFPPNPSCSAAALGVREVREAAVSHLMLLQPPATAKGSVPLSALGQKGPATLAEGGSCEPLLAATLRSPGRAGAALAPPGAQRLSRGHSEPPPLSLQPTRLRHPNIGVSI